MGGLPWGLPWSRCSSWRPRVSEEAMDVCGGAVRMRGFPRHSVISWRRQWAPDVLPRRKGRSGTAL